LNIGGSNESLFDPIKSLKPLVRKDEWGIFGQKRSERLSGFRKILDESPVKIRMHKEASQPFHTSMGW